MSRILFWLVLLVTMVYGPIAALLVELFPSRIRYTSMSLPYHIGNGWFGGFLPTTAFAMVAATGDIYYGLWYPIADRGADRGGRAAVPARDLPAQYRRLSGGWLANAMLLKKIRARVRLMLSLSKHLPILRQWSRVREGQDSARQAQDERTLERSVSDVCELMMLNSTNRSPASALPRR